MKIERSSGANVTSILERRRPGASFRPNRAEQGLPEPGLPEEQGLPEQGLPEQGLVLLPDMHDMNARQVVETIAKVLARQSC